MTTASFEALRTYTEGRAEFEEEHPAAAELFLRATKFDPDFALAYTWLGWCRLNLHDSRQRGVRKGRRTGASVLTRGAPVGAWQPSLRSEGDQGAHAAFWDLLKLDPLHFWALSDLDYYLRNDLREYEWVISFWEQQAAARPNDLRTLYRTAMALLNFKAHAGRAWPYFDRFLEATKDAPDGERWLQQGLRPPGTRLGCLGPRSRQGGRRAHGSRVRRSRRRPQERATNTRSVHQTERGTRPVAASRFPRPGRLGSVLHRLFRGDRETLTRLYESKTAARRPWACGSRRSLASSMMAATGREPSGAPFKFRHLADLARGPSPETLQWFAEQWQMSPATLFEAAAR